MRSGKEHRLASQARVRVFERGRPGQKKTLNPGSIGFKAIFGEARRSAEAALGPRLKRDLPGVYFV